MLVTQVSPCGAAKDLQPHADVTAAEFFEGVSKLTTARHTPCTTWNTSNATPNAGKNVRKTGKATAEVILECDGYEIGEDGTVRLQELPGRVSVEPSPANHDR